ncbi:MAG: DUF3168 domain-containing protein [Desulfuromonadaceae bacterium]|nr:DUF3168 domain-containing protein [Desulfuromonadaceae bacterium]
MTTSPLFELCSLDATVTSLLKEGNILKVFKFGSAPQDTKPPYVVWQNIGGVPINYLGERPDMENRLIQVDAYATTQEKVTEIIDAVEYAIEEDAHIVGYNIDELDVNTGLWRASFDAEFYNTRS